MKRLGWTLLFVIEVLCTNGAMADGVQFSYWGYRHKELHRLGIIDQLHVAADKSCCSGIYIGECRISIANIPEKKAFVDGQWIAFSDYTKVRAVEGLEAFHDGTHAPAVVCASRRAKNVYCVGVEPRT